MASGGTLCPLIDPAVAAGARNLVARNDTDCVSAFGMMPAAIPAYTLTIAVGTP
ncbi:MAG: hypothetical protein R3A48_28845 [Polyangiales bacterium]